MIQCKVYPIKRSVDMKLERVYYLYRTTTRENKMYTVFNTVTDETICETSDLNVVERLLNSDAELSYQYNG